MMEEKKTWKYKIHIRDCGFLSAFSGFLFYKTHETNNETGEVFRVDLAVDRSTAVDYDGRFLNYKRYKAFESTVRPFYSINSSNNNNKTAIPQ